MPISTFTGNFITYKPIFKKFKIYPEEFFEILKERNARLENPEQESDEIVEVDQYDKPSECFIDKMPYDIKLLILKFAGPRAYFKLTSLNSEWRKLLSYRTEEGSPRKPVAHLIKFYCLNLWP